MKKTVLQQLIEKWEKYKQKGTATALIWDGFIQDATELLETEREQIEEAYDAGFGKFNSSEQYYEDTYQS